MSTDGFMRCARCDKNIGNAAGHRYFTDSCSVCQCSVTHTLARKWQQGMGGKGRKRKEKVAALYAALIDFQENKRYAPDFRVRCLKLQ